MTEEEGWLRGRIAALVCGYGGRYGYCRITALLQNEVWRVNHEWSKASGVKKG